MAKSSPREPALTVGIDKLNSPSKSPLWHWVMAGDGEEKW